MGGKFQAKIDGKIDVIPVLPLLGLSYRQTLLHMSKRLVYIYTTEKIMIQSAICYIINPTLHAIKVSREQVEKCLRATFIKNTVEGIENVMRKKDTWVMH